MKVTMCRSKVYDVEQGDIVRIELLSGQIIEVPLENHTNWEVSHDPDFQQRQLLRSHT